MYHFPKKKEKKKQCMLLQSYKIMNKSYTRENYVVSMSATGFSFLMEKDRERNIKETYIQQDN